VPTATLAITASGLSQLTNALTTGYQALGFDRITQGDKLFTIWWWSTLGSAESLHC
jgi:hypothetical protein